MSEAVRAGGDDGFSQARRKKMFAWISLILLVLVSVVFLLLSPLWRKMVNPWTQTDLTFCSPKYHVCIADEPKWTVQIPIRDVFRPDEPIIRFLVLNFKTEKLDAAADITVLPPLRLDSLPIDIIHPNEYLPLFLERCKKEKPDFRVLEPPATIMVRGRELAVVRYSLTNDEKKDIEGETYVLVAGKMLGQMIYRAPKAQLERYRAEARKIIDSLTFNS